MDLTRPEPPQARPDAWLVSRALERAILAAGSPPRCWRCGAPIAAIDGGICLTCRVTRLDALAGEN